jgi:hypothetical protein
VRVVRTDSRAPLRLPFPALRMVTGGSDIHRDQSEWDHPLTEVVRDLLHVAERPIRDGQNQIDSLILVGGQVVAVMP